MRILIAASIFPPDIGGPARYVPDIAAGLAARGHDVHVVCHTDGDDGGRNGYPFTVTGISRRRSTPARMAATIRSLGALGNGADVLFANGLAQEARWAGRRLRLPVVHKVVGDFAWERARSRGWFDGSLDAYQVAAKSVRLRLLDSWRTSPLHQAAGVITPSRYLGRMVAGWGVAAPRIHVVYNAVTAEATGPAAVTLPAYNGHTLLTVCRLVPWKGVDGVIDVIAGLRDARLLVVGEGPCRARLERHAAISGASDRILWLGRRSAAEVEALMRASDMFVLNSSYEGLPHVVLEAMRARVPVVATAVGGTPEAVEDGVTGRLVPVGSPGALRDAVLDLIQSPDVAARLAARAAERLAARFDHESMVRATEDVLLRATGRSIA